MERKIAWEHYNPQEVLQDIMDEQYDNMMDDADDDFAEPMRPAQNQPKVVTNPFQPTDFFIGHTNFKLNKEHLHMLNFKVNGLEHFKVISPYRFYVVPGKMFEWSDVRLDIERHLCNRHITYTNNNSINNKIQFYKSNMKNPFWAILALPNGAIDYIDTDNYQLYLKQYDVYKKIQEKSSGILIESDTCKTKKSE